MDQARTAISINHEATMKLPRFMQGWFKPHPPEIVNAKQLLKAIDRGGIPLNPIKVNQIARSLGLEVSTSAPMPETIERIRATLKTAKVK